MNIQQYIRTLNAKLAGGDATEHSHRNALEVLLTAAAADALVTNEPKQIACGAPDFLLTRGEIPLGYVETKDIGKNLDDKSYKEQFQRYAGALDNLIITDYMQFRFYRDGEHVSTARIGEIRDGKIKSRPAEFAALENLFANFTAHDGVSITSADNLAAHMAARARMLAAAVSDSLAQDETAGGGEFQDQLSAFRKHLITDIAPREFADIYAQTIAYGMFTARLHDDAPAAFGRKKAADLIPAHNPFLRKFFRHIAAHDLDKRIRWIVDALANMFRVAAVEELMAGYGKRAGRADPFLHFYETFLGEYDPKKRKSHGVYYTPQPVVDFIVRAVDEILRGEFKLQDGIADSGKTTLSFNAAGDTAKTKSGAEKLKVHKVQILDPATGTGTFLAAIIRHIHQNYFARQLGLWPDYARADLLPRLHGFENLMAPYVMSHIKLEMELRETGCAMKDRARVYLTNTLEEQHPDTETWFARWLSEEANAANKIKRETPVMVVVGNPPYSVESKNNGEWILNLLQSYRKEPGGEEKLKERNSKSLNDDYVKFIRFGQYHVDRTGGGVLAYISNNGFLDNPTFRGMRWSLLQSFDKIFIVDLHGNAKKKGVSPDGAKDENVFLIRQGVSINLFVKTGEKKPGTPARVFHADLYGERENKFQFLSEKSLAKVKFAELTPKTPQLVFVPQNYALQEEYEKGFSIADAFATHSAGIATSRDAFTIYETEQELQTAIAKFRTLNDEDAREIFSLGADSMEWKISLARTDINENIFGDGENAPTPICYRPFDIRHTYYTGKSKGFHCRPRGKIMHHFLAGENVGLISIKRVRQNGEWTAIFVTDKISNGATAISALDKNFCFPLYLYPNSPQTELDEKPARVPNLNEEIVAAIATKTGLQFTPEKQTTTNTTETSANTADTVADATDTAADATETSTADTDTSTDATDTSATVTDAADTFAPIDILDYIYAVLHSAAYRAKFNEFLKIDFPRVPFPAGAKHFRALANFGAKLRAAHLMETTAAITTFNIPGDNTITAKINRNDFKITDAKNRTGNVFINDKQYFGDVPESAWNFFIGGYQPAQKYLKDRRHRRLSNAEIKHYQNIIAALAETGTVMAEIDAVWDGG